MECNRAVIKMTSTAKAIIMVTVTLTLCVDIAACNQGFTNNATEEDLQEQVDALIKSRYLIFPHIYRAFIDAGRVPGHYNITRPCQHDLSRYYHGLNRNLGWAWRLYDATGKQGSGLFLGALTWKGNFMECLNTLGYAPNKRANNPFDTNGDQPAPQYCSVFLDTPQWMYDIVESMALPFPVPLSYFIVDVCVPRTCTEWDLNEIVQEYVDEHSWGNNNFTVTDSSCYKGRDIQGDSAALFSMSLLLVLACVVGLGTAYDIFLRRRKLRAKRGPEFLIGYQKDTKQYGIIKVIWAPPATSKKLRRRATVGGYEGSSQYKLSELRVDREKLLNVDNKAASLPDVTADDNTGQEESARVNSLTMNSLINDLNDSRKKIDSQKDGSQTGNAQTDNPQKVDSKVEDSQTVDNGFDDNVTSETKSLLKNAEPEHIEMEPLVRKSSLTASKRSNSDPGRLNSDTTDSSATVDAASPLSQEREASPIEERMPPPSPPSPTRASPEMASHFDAQMPGSVSSMLFKHTPHSGRQPSIYEGHVAASLDRESRRRRAPPSNVKHTPHVPGRHGSIYERQLSEVSNDDSVFEQNMSPRHRLYDIPEEETNLTEKENGHAKNKLTPEIVVKPRPVEKERRLWEKMLLSFSFRRSTKRLIAEGSADTLFCLNGVRVLSICWIVLGNVYLVIYLNPDVVDNHVDAVKLTQTFWVQAVINTTLAADSFFILSGTLGAYNFMKMKKDCKGKKLREVMTVKEYFMLIFHRLVRIGPCYLLIIMMFTNLMPYMGKGPRWKYEIQSVRTCKDRWWANALFISNFYKADDMCMPHTYYLVNDFQFGLLMPFIMVPMLCFPKVGFLLLGLLVMTQIVSTLILDEGINGNVLRMTKTDYFARIYVKPYCRVGVYAIGLGLGYLLYVTQRQVKFRRLPLTIFWVLSMVVIGTLPYITYAENRQGGREWTGIETALFEALSRPLWGLALSWVIFACSTGQGAFVNKLLSWNAFLPLCRITYGVYLLHPMLIAIVIGSRHNGFFLDFGELTYEFVADLVFSYTFAFFLISFVECPFVLLEHSIRTHFQQRKKLRH